MSIRAKKITVKASLIKCVIIVLFRVAGTSNRLDICIRLLRFDGATCAAKTVFNFSAKVYYNEIAVRVK